VDDDIMLEKHYYEANYVFSHILSWHICATDDGNAHMMWKSVPLQDSLK
jgi:hypothetical protein